MGLSAAVIAEQSNQGDDSNVPLFLRPAYNALYANKGFEVFEFRYDSGSKSLLRGFLGNKDATLFSPFSAPFGGFWPLTNDVSLSDYTSLAQDLREFLGENDLAGCHLTLPPACYGNEAVSRQMHGFLGAGFSVDYVDVNHSLDLTKEDFSSGLRRGGRRSLRNAESQNLVFVEAGTEPERRRAYNVIQTNRRQKDNPMHLSYDDLLEVRDIAEVTFFLITKDDEDVAGAVVYAISPGIMQVVYWGHDVNFNELNPIHFLASNLFRIYQGTASVLDIGPSSSHGVADDGLCQFKESIGCSTTLKFSLVYHT